MAGKTGTATTTDGTRLRTHRWSAADPWAALLLVHGLAEHAGRYAHVAEELARAGIEVHAYDQRGFGGSEGPRAYVDRWSILHEDLEERLGAVRAEHPDLPLVLYGHSLGGLVVTGHVLGPPLRTLPDLLVLSAPALQASVPAWKRGLAGVLCVVVPRLAMENGLPSGGLSRDPSVTESYANDPLRVPRTTTRFATEAFREQARINALLDAGVVLPIPTYVLHGDVDPVVPPAASERLVGHGPVTRRVHPGLRHECHNEPEWPVVVRDVVTWIRSNVAAPEGRAV